MRGGGSKAVWNFSENSSILEGEGVPNKLMMMMVMVKVMSMLNNIGSGYSGGLSYFLPEEVGKSCFTALYVLNGLSTLGYVLPQ